MPTTVTGFLLLLLPVGALAVGGALLWRRLRSTPTLLVALGFAATFLGQIVDLRTSYELSVLMSQHPGDTFFVAHHHSLPLLTHYAGLVGLWVAALGLIWHAVMQPPASPNNRWRSP